MDRAIDNSKGDRTSGFIRSEYSKIDGWEGLAFVKRQFPNIRVPHIYGLWKSDKFYSRKKEGADEFLEKPFDMGEIINIIKRYYN